MKSKLLLVFIATTVAFSCKKKDDGDPIPTTPTNPTTQQKCTPQEIEFVAELGTNGTTHWADSFAYDGSGSIIKVVHKHSPWGIYYNFTYNNGSLLKIERYENTGLNYIDSVFWNSAGYVQQVKVYNSNNTLAEDIKFTYSGTKLTKREINYYPSNNYFAQVFLYNADGTLSKTQVFEGNNQLQSTYTYTYSSGAVANKAYDAGKKKLMDIHWNLDDWEMSIYDMFNYSPKVATGIEFQEVGSPLESYTVIVDTNTNGYVTKLKSNGHDVVNLSYQCK